MNKILILILTLFLVIIAGSEFYLKTNPQIIYGEKKDWILTPEGLISCYSTSPNENYKSFYEFFDKEKDLQDPKFAKMGKRTPYCLRNSAKKREKGKNPERKKRVMIVGDSFALSEGVSDKDSLGYVLNALDLSKNFQNLGRPNYNIWDVFLMMTNLVVKKPAPESIVYVMNINDVLVNADWNKKQFRLNNFMQIQQENFLRRNKSFEDTSTYIQKYFKFEALIANGKEKAIQYYKDLYNSPKNSAELKKTFEHLDAMSIEAKKYSVPFYVFIQPIMYQSISGDYPLSNEHQIILDFCKLTDIKCFDLLNAFEEKLEVYKINNIDYHLNAKGIKSIAKYIKGKLERN